MNLTYLPSAKSNSFYGFSSDFTANLIGKVYLVR